MTKLKHEIHVIGDGSQNAPHGILNAISLDAKLLKNGCLRWGNARVHSVFKNALNLIIGQERLMTLVNRNFDNAPDTIVTDTYHWNNVGLEIGDTVEYSEGQISLPIGIAVCLRYAHSWSCQLPAYDTAEDTLLSNVTFAERYIEQYGRGVGLKAAVGYLPKNVETTMIRGFQHLTDDLYQSLARSDLVHAEKCIQQIVGMGPGLTPSGDDYLMGLLAVLNIPESPAYSLRKIGDYVLESANHQTHQISIAGLRQAANGRVRERLVDLCGAIMQTHLPVLQYALHCVLEIGSSSGTDIALGMLTGFKLHMQWSSVGRPGNTGQPKIEGTV